MKYRKVITMLFTASMLSITGCSKDTEPVTSESVIETEEQEVEPEQDNAEQEQETAEPEENEDNTVDSLSEKPEVEMDTGSSEETPDTTEDSATFIESGADGVDTQDTDALIAEYESESADIYINPEGMDENHDGRGFNKTTGEYEPDFDTNNGEGWDINGKHYKTRGEYNKSPEMTQGCLTPEELAIEEKADKLMETCPNGVRLIYDESGKLIDAVPNNPNNE